MSERAEVLRWIVFQRLMEGYNPDFLGDEATVRRIEEAVEKAARELEARDEVVIEIPFISAGSEGVNSGPTHFRETIRREDLEPYLEGNIPLGEPDVLTDDDDRVLERTDEGAQAETSYLPETMSPDWAPPRGPRPGGAEVPRPLGPESSAPWLLFILIVLGAAVALLIYLR